MDPHIHYGAAIKAMGAQGLWGVAERTVVRAITIRVGQFLHILLDGAPEWV